MCLKLFPSVLFATFWCFFNHQSMAQIQWHNSDTTSIVRRDTGWVVFSRLELGQKFKKIKNPFTNIKFRFQSTCQEHWRVGSSIREEIFLHLLHPFLAWDMIWVIFSPFVLGSTQLLHHFLGYNKVAKKSKLWCHVLDFI